jgi:hypothetical protein
MKLFPLSTIAIVVLSVSSAVARRTGRGWNRDDDWGGASKSSKTAQPTFYPTLSPTYSPTLGKSSKSWWGGWKDDDDDDWKGWRGYNHKKQYMKKFHHKRRNGHHNRWGRDLVGTELDAASEIVVDEEVHDSSGK